MQMNTIMIILLYIHMAITPMIRGIGTIIILVWAGTITGLTGEDIITGTRM